MQQFIYYTSIVIFSIFIGSQITEGALLVPYWQSLSSTDFYSYYNEFGPSIGRFYTILTIIAALIPVSLAIYCKKINSRAFKLAFISSLYAILFVATFYMYFKGTNELFFQASFTDVALKNELITWSYWHWGRIIIECMSLIFLILSLNSIQNNTIYKRET